MRLSVLVVATLLAVTALVAGIGCNETATVTVANGNDQHVYLRISELSGDRTTFLITLRIEEGATIERSFSEGARERWEFLDADENAYDRFTATWDSLARRDWRFAVRQVPD